MMKKTVTTMMGLCALALASTTASAASLLGGSWNTPTLFDINTTTGTASNPRVLTPAPSNLAGLTVSPAGQVYGLVFTTGGTGSTALSTINPVTGAQTVIGATGLANVFEGDLDFSPTTGKLFAIQNVPSNYQMFEINPATGAALTPITLSGATFGDLSAMSFASNGTLYMLDTSSPAGSSLLTVNPTTGAVTSNVTLSVDVGDTAGIDFNPDNGKLYLADGNNASTNTLYTVNLTNGILTPIGTTRATGLAALAFIPEPGSALAGAVLIPLLRRRQR